MSRILLADDSPHAQRMGERILREEGYEVVTVTDGITALLRLPDVDPDVVFADVSLPNHSGYEICKRIKANPNHHHVRVILTAGLLETFDDVQAKEAHCDGILKKPFESSVVLETVKPLIAAAQKERSQPEARKAAAAQPEQILSKHTEEKVEASPSPAAKVEAPKADVVKEAPARPEPPVAETRARRWCARWGPHLGEGGAERARDVRDFFVLEGRRLHFHRSHAGCSGSYRDGADRSGRRCYSARQFAC